MKLTKRLSCVAGKVDKGSKVADIGTDHAYIPIFLVKNNISKKVIAADVKIGPISIAKENIKKNGMEPYIETRLGYGLKVLDNGEVDTVIIAGMGGELIREILDKSKELCRDISTFILQPMTAHEELREFLYKNGYVIKDETLVKEDGKMYTIMVCVHGDGDVSGIYYDIGIKLIENKDPLLNEYIDGKIKEMQKILNTLKDKETDNAKIRRLECEKKLGMYMELRNKLVLTTSHIN